MTVYAVAIVNTEGHAESVYIPGGTFQDEGPWELDNTKTVVHITTQIEDIAEWSKVFYYKDGGWADRPPSPGEYYYWKDEEWVFDSEHFWKLVREDRNVRLWKTDWTQISDNDLTDAKKAEWREYRSVLRIIPAQQSNAKTLKEIVWPTEPS